MSPGIQKNLIGQTFGYTQVIQFHDRIGGKARWLCRCQCGKEHVADGYNLSSGNTSSCGCFRVKKTRERTLKTGKCRSKEYGAHQNMRGRCYHKSNPRYKNYGGRGIKICDRWLGPHGFENFLSDMGEAPSVDHSVERRDNDGNYEPSNCYWMLRSLQSGNRQTTLRVTVDGEVMSLAAACRKLGKKYTTVQRRYYAGKTPQEALEA